MPDNRDPVRLFPGQHGVTFWLGPREDHPSVQVDMILYTPDGPPAPSGHGELSWDDVRKLRDAIDFYLRD